MNIVIDQHAALTQADIRIIGMANIALLGETSALADGWVGDPEGRRGLQSFALVPFGPIAWNQIEYRAYSQRDEPTRWTLCGDLCGSERDDDVVSAVEFRLSGEAALEYALEIEAVYTDGTISKVVTTSGEAHVGGTKTLAAFKVNLLRPNALDLAARWRDGSYPLPDAEPDQPIEVADVDDATLDAFDRRSTTELHHHTTEVGRDLDYDDAQIGGDDGKEDYGTTLSATTASEAPKAPKTPKVQVSLTKWAVSSLEEDLRQLVGKDQLTLPSKRSQADRSKHGAPTGRVSIRKTQWRMWTPLLIAIFFFIF